MSDISKEIVKKEVFKASVYRSSTLVPLGMGIVATSIYFISGPTNTLLVVMAGGFSFGVSSFLYNKIIKKDRHSSNYLKKLEKEFLDKEKKDLRILKRSLRSTKLEDDIKAFGEQAYDQLNKIQDKYKNYKKVLDEKFNPGELTHRRYLGVCEEVYLLTLDNLKSISSILEITNSINTESINERLMYFEKVDVLSEDQEVERETLTERTIIKEKQFKELSRLLSINEEALTKIDETAMSLSTITTNHGQSGQHIELALKNLEYLAKSANKYDIK